MECAKMDGATHLPEEQQGFHQSWFPVGLARDLLPDRVVGADFLGTRVVMYRDPDGKAIVAPIRTMRRMQMSEPEEG
jgi:phenylpropionate dioxygenase-like ring-hydroxylating dioxygenase large terminal subunit